MQRLTVVLTPEFEKAMKKKETLVKELDQMTPTKIRGRGGGGLGGHGGLRQQQGISV